jgi:2-oxoisovalerate dehydrogenase E2 component (dihydrolipoyl transacylase)
MGRYVFKLPDVGEGTAEAEVVTWHVKPGDKVAEDQPLVDVMTDKATVEITSPVEGVVSSIHGEPGEMAAVGSALVVLEVEGAGNSDEASAPAPAKAEKPKPEMKTPSPAAAPASAAPQGRQGGYVFRLPDVGEGTAEAEIVAWHVKPGDKVAEDQPLVDVMTDKATVEITSPVAGLVASIHGEPGQMAAVGGALVTFDVEGAPVAAAPAPVEAKAATPESKAAPKAAPVAPAKSNVTVSRPTVARVPGERPLASPAVRRRARELGVELQFVGGSGPAGRIEHGDLDAFIAGGGRTPMPVGGGGSLYARRDGTEEIKIIGLRRKIAEKMAESKRRIPHFMYAEEVDVTELEALRGHLNATREAGRPKLTLLPFIIRALCRTLPEHPSINSRFDDEAGVVTRYEAVHCGIATQTANGLMVPVVRHAEALDVWGCAAEIVRVSGAARDGSATKEELTGSTITVTSLGPMGGLVHAPVVNYPEVAIVGPNKIIERPVVRDGQVVVRKMMNISSSFDHRIVDGWDAAEFIQKIKAALEHPATLFMD